MKKKLGLFLILNLLTVVIIFSGLGTAQEVSTVRVAMKTEPASLHPITTQGTEVNVVLAQISDPLLSVDEKGNFTTEGSILEDFSIEEDGKVYVFNIREGITFHNGEVLDAEVLKFNYESWLDEKLASPYRAYYTVIDNMEIVDDYTLKVTLNKGDVTFLSYCQFNEHIVPKQYIEEVGWDGYAQKPIGTGPYKFVEYNSGRRILLEKNENYWGKEVDIDRVEFNFYPESNSAVMATMTKEVDFYLEPNAEEYKRLKDEPGIASAEYRKFQDDRICFNKREDSIFSDVRLRQAVAYAINRDEIITLTRGDMAVPAVGRVPDFHPATAPNANDYEYNPEKAKELLAEAGYPDGFETSIYVASNHKDRVQEAQLIQQHLAQVGIDCEVVAIEWGTYLDVTATGEAPMFRERWVTGGPSPYDFVELYHKDSSWNSIFGTYDKPVVNALVEELVTTVDNEERWAIYREIQEIVLEDAACYPLYWPIQGAVYNDELHIPEESFTAFNEYIDIENWSFK